MRISEETSARFLELIKVDEELQHWPSQKLEVRFEANIIKCQHSVWVSADALTRFEKELIQLEEARSGKARLESLSPHELELEIAIVDPAGHVGVSVRVSRQQTFEGGSQYTVGTEFKI